MSAKRPHTPDDENSRKPAKSRRIEETSPDRSAKTTDRVPSLTDITNRPRATSQPAPSLLTDTANRPLPATPKPRETAMEITPDADIRNYYVGLPGNPKLLARSSSEPWARPLVANPDAWNRHAWKRIFNVGDHSLEQKLRDGLRTNIHRVLDTMKNPIDWISVDYVRLGYETSAEKNPVVILVTVDKDQVTSAEAQRLVDALYRECVKVDLLDVEVEIKEGRRANAADLYPAIEPLPIPTAYPLAGASIGVPVKPERVGTLGGYVEVDGKVYGLTNHHIAFDPLEHPAAFPTEKEKSENQSCQFFQPSKRDIVQRVNGLKSNRKFWEQKQKSNDDPDNVAAEQILAIDKELKNFQPWLNSKACRIGKLWKSSGLRTRGVDDVELNFGLDWALIELGNSVRFTTGEATFVNSCPSANLNHICKTGYRSDALSAANIDQSYVIPTYLRRGLSFQELKHQMRKGDEFIVWKVGRTTHFTFGVVSHIASDYHLDEGLISAQLMIMDCRERTEIPFSRNGDSGSFVWDFQGHVCGLLWGGKDKDFATYVTPIEFVLEDIRKQCNAKVVKLVVRPEESDELPDPPPPALTTPGKEQVAEQDTGADSVGFDIDMEEAFNAGWDSGCESEKSGDPMEL